jgi:hypothetical protein
MQSAAATADTRGARGVEMYAPATQRVRGDEIDEYES